MIAAAALLVVAQATVASKTPPPPVVMTPDQARKFYDTMPLIIARGQRFRIFAIEGTGDRRVLDQAAKKLTSEGWKCDVSVDVKGVLSLAVFATNRTLGDVQKLASRFAAHEFGAIEARPELFSDPGG